MDRQTVRISTRPAPDRQPDTSAMSVALRRGPSCRQLLHCQRHWLDPVIVQLHEVGHRFSEALKRACCHKRRREGSRQRTTVYCAHLDERPTEEESMHKANLHTAEEWGDTRTVRRQVGEKVSHNGRRGDRSLKHANEWIAIDGLNDLLLHNTR
jgi:hypothetical protein